MRDPLLHLQNSESQRSSERILALFVLIFVITVFHQSTKGYRSFESAVGPSTPQSSAPSVSNQKIQQCVDLKGTCMGKWVSTQGSSWEDVLSGGSLVPPTAKRSKSEGSSTDSGYRPILTHAILPICSDLGDYSSVDLRCGNFADVYDYNGQILGQGSYGEVKGIKLKEEFRNNMQDPRIPRYWLKSTPSGVTKVMTGSTNPDNVLLMYREAIMSQGAYQRLLPTMPKSTAFAVDVYESSGSQIGNIVMQPVAKTTLDDAKYRQFFLGNQRNAKLLLIELLRMIQSLHGVAGICHLDIKPLNLLVSGSDIILTDWYISTEIIEANDDGELLN